MKLTTPLAESIRIVLVGLRNAGKSSLMNKILRQEASIVSPRPGTTADPVTRRIEITGLGPAALTDTAGLDDDEAEVGALRAGKSGSALEKADILVLVSAADRPLEKTEQELLDRWKDKPLVIALTFADKPPHEEKAEMMKSPKAVLINNLNGDGVEALRKKLAGLGNLIDPEMTPIEGLVNEGDLVVLVAPVDLGAPTGRLILPQVETIRDLLDRDCPALIVKEREFGGLYRSLNPRPALVVTDSQVFHKVAADISENQKFTSFSILFARKKGDLSLFAEGLAEILRVGEKPRILVLEGCSHHKQADDIGSVKIPRLFRQLIRADAEFLYSRDLPGKEELETISGVIHCGSCMQTRRSVLARLQKLREARVPVTNYGVFLAWAQGALPRALDLFPEARDRYLSAGK